MVEGSALPERDLDIWQLLHYVVSYPAVTAVVGTADVAHLKQNVRTASAFEAHSEEEMTETRALAQGRPG